MDDHNDRSYPEDGRERGDEPQPNPRPEDSHPTKDEEGGVIFIENWTFYPNEVNKCRKCGELYADMTGFCIKCTE